MTWEGGGEGDTYKIEILTLFGKFCIVRTCGQAQSLPLALGPRHPEERRNDSPCAARGQLPEINVPVETSVREFGCCEIVHD